MAVIILSIATAVIGFTGGMAWGLRDDIRRQLAAKRNRKESNVQDQH